MSDMADVLRKHIEFTFDDESRLFRCECGLWMADEDRADHLAAALSAAGFGPVQEARAEALEEAAAWLDNAEQVQNIAFDGPSDIGSLSAKYDAALEEPAEWLRARALAERGRQ